MANIIDALIVTLGLDATNFKKGTEETGKTLDDTKRRADASAAAVEQSQGKTQGSFRGTGKQAIQTADDIEKGSKRTNTSLRSVDVQASTLGKSFSAMGEAGVSPFAALALAAGGAVAAIAAVKGAMGDTIDTAASGSALGRAASMAGIDVTKYAAWGNAIASFGGSAEDAQGSLAGLAKQQAQMQLTGQPSQAMAVLEQFGIRPSEDPMQVMKDLASNPRLQSMSAAQKSYVLQNVIGLDAGSASAIERGPDYINKLLATQAAKGNLTEPQVQTMDTFNTAVGNLDQSFDRLKTNVEVSLMPALTDFILGLTTLVNWLDDKFPGFLKGAETAAKGIASNPAEFTGTPAKADQKAVLDQGMKFFMGQGMSNAQAAGIMSNVERESSYNPHPAIDPNNPHYGLFQWSEARRQDILKATGIDVAKATAGDQFKAAQWELKNRYPQVLAAIKADKGGMFAAGDIATIFGQGFEKYDNPGNRDQGEMMRRWYEAQRLHAGWTPDAPGPSLSSGPHPRALDRLRNIGASSGGAANSNHTHNIENHITVNAPSGDAHAIAHTVVSKLSQHQGMLAQVGGTMR